MSADAQRLLSYLRRWCTTRDTAHTHARIAQALELPARSIVDLADELLAADHLVVAETTSPMGCWLVADDADLPHAHRYAEVLASRAGKVFRRRDHVLRIVARRESTRVVDSTGQRRLFA